MRRGEGAFHILFNFFTEIYFQKFSSVVLCGRQNKMRMIAATSFIRIVLVVINFACLERPFRRNLRHKSAPHQIVDGKDDGEKRRAPPHRRSNFGV